MRFFYSGIEGKTSQSEELALRFSALSIDLSSDTVSEGGKEILSFLPEGVHELVGVSFGGLCCLQAASMAPHRISSVYLIRVLTHVRYAPLLIRAQRRLLPLVPSVLFDRLYKRRHPRALSIIGKKRLYKRLSSVWSSLPSVHVELPVYWIDPVGPIPFGDLIDEEELL